MRLRTHLVVARRLEYWIIRNVGGSVKNISGNYNHPKVIIQVWRVDPRVSTVRERLITFRLTVEVATACKRWQRKNTNRAQDRAGSKGGP